MRTPRRETLRSQFLLPAGLLVVAAMTSLTMFFLAGAAGASGHSDTSQVTVNPTHVVTTPACGTVNVKGVTGSRAQRRQPVPQQQHESA